MDTEPINDALLALLRADPRASNKSIAEALKISEAAVAARIRGLLESGTIRVALQQDTHAGSPGMLAAIVEFYIDDPSRTDEVAADIARRPAVFSAYQTAQRPEIIANIRAGSPQDMNAIITELATNIPHLNKLRTYPVLGLGRFSTTVGSLRSPAAKPEAHDLGERLVALLQEDGRRSVSSLARELGLSVTAVRARMQTLLKRPGVRIALVCDAQALGLTTWFDIRIEVRPDKLQSAIGRFSEHRSVRVVAHLAGEANLGIFVVARTLEELDCLVEQEVRPLPGLIDFTLIRVTNVFKYDFNYNI